MKKTLAAAVKRLETTCAAACPTTPKRRGRPLSFDRAQALDQAMHVFWEQGYEGASITALTAAMGITPPSLYAAFGDKEQLFLEAVEHYMGPAKGCPKADELVTAREAIEVWLREAALELTSPCHPRGCMVMTAATACSSSSRHVQAALADHMNALRQKVCTRLRRAVDEGELPPRTDVAALADFYLAVVQGMSFQARGGATRDTLLTTVDVAMRAWPDRPPAEAAAIEALPANTEGSRRKRAEAAPRLAPASLARTKRG